MCSLGGGSVAGCVWGGSPELIEVLTFRWDGVKRVPADSQSAASRSRALTPASHHSALLVSSFPPFFHSSQTPTHQLHTHTHWERARHRRQTHHPDAKKQTSALRQPGNTATNSGVIIREKIAEAAKAAVSRWQGEIISCLVTAATCEW